MADLEEGISRFIEGRVAFFGNMNTPKPAWLKNPKRAKEIAVCLTDEFGKEMVDHGVSVGDGTTRARRALASPVGVVASHAYDKLRRSFGY